MAICKILRTITDENNSLVGRIERNEFGSLRIMIAGVWEEVAKKINDAIETADFFSTENFEPIVISHAPHEEHREVSAITSAVRILTDYKLNTCLLGEKM